MAFLASTPGVLLEAPAFWRDFRYELLEHSQRGHGDLFRYLPPAVFRWLEHRAGWHLCATAQAR